MYSNNSIGYDAHPNPHHYNNMAYKLPFKLEDDNDSNSSIEEQQHHLQMSYNDMSQCTCKLILNFNPSKKKKKKKKSYFIIFRYGNREN
jgi:hypothetical protein